jgi:hypothetical protein
VSPAGPESVSSATAERPPADLPTRPGPPADPAGVCGLVLGNVSIGGSAVAMPAVPVAVAVPAAGPGPGRWRDGIGGGHGGGSQPETQQPALASPGTLTGPRSRAAATTRPAPRPALLPCLPDRCGPRRQADGTSALESADHICRAGQPWGCGDARNVPRCVYQRHYVSL